MEFRLYSLYVVLLEGQFQIIQVVLLSNASKYKWLICFTEVSKTVSEIYTMEFRLYSLYVVLLEGQFQIIQVVLLSNVSKLYLGKVRINVSIIHVKDQLYKWIHRVHAAAQVRVLIATDVYTIISSMVFLTSLCPVVFLLR